MSVVLEKREASEVDDAPVGKVRLFIDEDGQLSAKDENGDVVAPQALIASLEALVDTKQDASTAVTDAELASEKSARETADATLTAAAAGAKATADAALPKAGGTMTGALTLAGDASTNLQPVTKQQLTAAIDALINGAPEALDTLKEISDRLGLDESAEATLIATVATKLAKSANLSDLASASTSRTNLGLGTAATKDSGAAGEGGKVLAADDRTVLDAKARGCKGDGESNDATAINTAINALNAAGGGTLYFPAGTYLVKSNIALKSKVSIVGAGREAVTIKAAAGVTTAPLTAAEADAIQDVTIRDLTIDGNASAFSGNVFGISITKGTRISITNVRIRNTYHIGVFATGCTDLSIDSCSLHECGKTSTGPNGIQVVKCTRAKVLFNTITDWGNGNNGRAIFVAESPGTQITGNNISNPGSVDSSHMISLDFESHQCVITDNVLTNAAYAGVAHKCIGISVINSSDVLVGNNRLLQPSQNDGSYEPIQVEGTAARVTVTGNHCEFGDDNGITAWGAGGHVVVGNKVRNCSHHGISVNSPNCVVSGNSVKNSGQNPVEGINPSGIALLSGVTDTVAVGNRCYDDQAVKTQLYGVAEFGTADKNTILGNNLAGNSTEAVKAVGANTIVGANLGLTPRKGEVEIHDIGAAAFADEKAAGGQPVLGTALLRSDTGQVGVRTGANAWTALAKEKLSTITDAAEVTPSFSNGNHFLLNAKGNRTIKNVSNRLAGMVVTFDIHNESGGAIVTNWNEAYKFAGAWVDPANGKSRTVTFYCYDGTNWRELCRSAADI